MHASDIREYKPVWDVSPGTSVHLQYREKSREKSWVKQGRSCENLKDQC